MAMLLLRAIFVSFLLSRIGEKELIMIIPKGCGVTTGSYGGPALILAGHSGKWASAWVHHRIAGSQCH